MIISEVFYSVQGEGLMTGVPSVFVRTSGCNLRCRWCDTPYTSWNPEGDQQSVDDIVAAVVAHRAARHVVVTGGEPMIAPGFGELCDALRARGFHVTVETAGTVWQDGAVDLYSISPKLSTSTPDDVVWTNRHESRRLNLDVLRKMVSAGAYQLKFVVTGRHDLDEIRSLLAEVGDVEPHRVLLMPESREPEELEAKQLWVSELCKEFGYRFCDRLHLRLYGNKRGT
ncbi:MAG: 7-carboxy-7-deazaguanine synthase QueE [Planctomycetota bacterium]